MTDQDRAETLAQDPEVDQLVEDIEETRQDMTGTVEAIGDRLDPRNIVADAKETVRSATVGKVEEMANTAGDFANDATETVREAGSSVVDTITRNPVPAAMIGLGLGWLAMSSRSSSKGHGSDRHGSRSNGANQGNRGNGGDPIAEAQRRVGAVADDVGAKVDRAAGQVGRFADEVPYQVRSVADDVSESASRMFQTNPLAVGAIAVAVGTAVGLALPATEMERRKLAQPAREVIGKAEEAATDALEQVEQHARDVEDQALEEDRQTKPH